MRKHKIAAVGGGGGGEGDGGAKGKGKGTRRGRSNQQTDDQRFNRKFIDRLGAVRRATIRKLKLAPADFKSPTDAFELFRPYLHNKPPVATAARASG
eukprot:g14902.t1